jgi:hypothetical protein
MRNGTQSKLTLIDNAGNELSARAVVDDLSVSYDDPPRSGEEAEPRSEPFWTNKRVFAAVSIACATAAIAAGTYAIWLSRQTSTASAITDVREILENANKRMSQMEADLHTLSGPNGNAA